MSFAAVSRLNARLRDAPRWRRLLEAPGSDYLALCNRGESLERAPDGSGFRCAWRWTSQLRAPHLLPELGLALLHRALRDHPIRLASVPLSQDPPRVSFVIGHRGAARIPLLLATLASIAAQDVPVECIVVEQDDARLLPGALPAWVRLVHTPLPQADMPYSRAWAFNEGVRHARAPLLVLHDNDMLVPTAYARAAAERLDAGFDAFNPKRFVFYLAPAHTDAVLRDAGAIGSQAPEAIVQNLEGGGSVAITRSAYESIGGMDERFLGWGGEDVECWERAQLLRLWPYAALPLVHLWHASQAGKATGDAPGLALYHELARIPPQERVARLRGLRTG